MQSLPEPCRKTPDSTRLPGVFRVPQALQKARPKLSFGLIRCGLPPFWENTPIKLLYDSGKM